MPAEPDAAFSVDAATPVHDAASPDAGNAVPSADAGADAGGQPAPSYLGELQSAADYAALAAPGAEVKYLSQVDGTEPPPVFGASECLFQNTRTYPYHVEFLRTFPTLTELSAEGYEDAVLRRESRNLYAGVLKLLPGARHPQSGETGVLGYSVYAAVVQDEQLSVQELSDVHDRLKACIPFAQELLVFLPENPAQLRATQALAQELQAAGIAFADPARLNPGTGAEAYSGGEAYGYLRLPTQLEPEVGPRDIVVIDAAPNDLGLVAGLITRQPQSVASHLNLRLREKGIPNARATALFDSAVLQQWQAQLVHLVVTDNSASIEPAQLEQAEAFWEAHRPPTGQLHSDVETRALTPLHELKHANAVTYGVKAANLGELHAVLPAANRMQGFALPFAAYADFIAENALQPVIDAVLTDAQLHLDASYKASALKTLRNTLRAAEVPASWEQSLHAAVLDAYGEAGLSTRLRFRSSTNAEDLPGLSGAGLYDSASGCIADDLDDDEQGPSLCLSAAQQSYYEQELALRSAELEEFPERTFLADVIEDLQQELSSEKSARAALKKVWASLWNERAFDDRNYYGLEHHDVYMGMAVHPALVGEQLEAVVVTNLEPNTEQPLYRVVSQLGEVGVVRPYNPNATAEIQSFRRASVSQLSELKLVAASSLLPEGERLWSAAQMAELAELLFRVQDHFESSVYPDLTPLSLDIEVDVAADGSIVLKQARPYANLTAP